MESFHGRISIGLPWKCWPPSTLGTRTRPPPHSRPPTPVFGRRHAILDILAPDQPKNSAAASEHIVIQDSPVSPDPSPPSSPVDSPSKKNRAPSPPMSPSKVKCEAARYVLTQDHQFECPWCPLPSSPTLNGHFDLGMHGEVWPQRRLAGSPVYQYHIGEEDLLRPPLRDRPSGQFLAPLDLGICFMISWQPSPGRFRYQQRQEHHLQ